MLPNQVLQDKLRRLRWWFVLCANLVLRSDDLLRSGCVVLRSGRVVLRSGVVLCSVGRRSRTGCGNGSAGARRHSGTGSQSLTLELGSRQRTGFSGAGSASESPVSFFL